MTDYRAEFEKAYSVIEPHPTTCFFDFVRVKELAWQMYLFGVTSTIKRFEHSAGEYFSEDGWIKGLSIDDWHELSELLDPFVYAGVTGVCPECGASNPKEASDMCKPSIDSCTATESEKLTALWDQWEKDNEPGSV